MKSRKKASGIYAWIDLISLWILNQIIESFSDKDLGFLRIGSLNVRVKKTTEAFSNFLGVGNSGSVGDSGFDRVQKSWGSADNITKVWIIFYLPFNIEFSSEGQCKQKTKIK